jgi:hypothetical protein
MFAVAKRILLAAVCSTPVAGQAIACPTAVVPYFGWDATDCGQCNIYGSYLEYLTPPRIRDVMPGGPAANRLRDNDVLLAVDGLSITTPAAWHRMRDVAPGDSVRFSVRRGLDTAAATIIPSARCAAPSDPRIPHFDRVVDLRRTQPERSLSVGNTTVEISGKPDSVTYDPKSGEAVILVRGVVVRVKAKSP